MPSRQRPFVSGHTTYYQKGEGGAATPTRSGLQIRAFTTVTAHTTNIEFLPVHWREYGYRGQLTIESSRLWRTLGMDQVSSV